MSHDDAHGPKVETLGVLEAEERILEESGWEHDLVLGGRVVGVDGGRGHGPFRPLHRLVQLTKIRL